MRRPLRVLTWHVHGSYLNYLSHVPVTWVLPVRPERDAGYVGRGARFEWPDNVIEVAAPDVAQLELDLVLTQSRRNWEVDRHELLGRRVEELPRIHLEHDPPRAWPNDALHFVQDPDALLVHVTPFNALMWDAGITPSAVVEHGVAVPDLPWTGDRPLAVTVVNNLYQRGRRLGSDIFDRVAARLPVDLAGLNGEPHPRWVGDVPPRQLHQRLPSYRVFFNPIRYTSLGLAVCEALALGLPVVGLATTELSTVVTNGVNGYVVTDPGKLVPPLRRLLCDKDEAAHLSVGAKETARTRFGLERFVAEWGALIEARVRGDHAATATTAPGVPPTTLA